MPASTGATINGIAWAFRISKLTWGNEGQCVHKHETMTSKTPKTKNKPFNWLPIFEHMILTMKGGFVEWMCWVDSAFYDQGAIWILSRGFCQIQLHTLTAQQQLPQGNTIHRITAAGFGHHKTEEFETSAPWKRVNSGAPMCLVTWRSCKNQEAVGISSLLQCINGRGQWGQTWHYGKMLVKNQAHHAIFRLDQIRTSVKWPLYHGQMLQSALIPRPCPTYWFWMILMSRSWPKSIPLHQPNLVLMQKSISDENFRIHGQRTATHESHHCLCTADPKLPGRLATIHHCGESIWLHSLSTVSIVPPLLKWDPRKRREDYKQQRNYTTKISNASGTMQICSWVAQEPW